ncbi:PurR family transcriptional regulator [Lapidilactobacillus dextrinicus DSM 20335]|uniref:PurR family transcriptional regulator n=1 Tax=Lapidilactobacillus dextrinicus DSM 20335 TaxID=1423738 RepID=A0A0R2BVP2_9LACO|nr:LacI family DNA-binding transcriptional regulator [Lapidilactobacillus dextrinicus]KRM79603.1 PurR family transcriptional regulator [Lapidilactobacillus dextrinicus DSM 20335]
MGIREIADKAGVSISTVSYALNGSSKVTEQTRERIKAIAKEMNYTPNLAGRMLKNQKTNIVGMYVSDFGGDFYSHVIDGIAQKLKENHYELIVGSGGSRSRSFIPQNLVDGAIVLDSNFPTDIITDYANSGHQIVVMDRELSIPNVRQVLLDDEMGAHQAVNALIESKVEHFILVTGPSDSRDSIIRMQTAIAEVEKSTGKPVIVISSNFTVEGGRKAAKSIASMGLDNVGIFALNDELAIGLYEVLPEYGLHPGKEVKIIGFDNDELGRYLTPPLTTIDYSKHHWGELAAETLLEMISSSGEPTDKLIQSKVIHRNSLGEKKLNDKNVKK